MNLARSLTAKTIQILCSDNVDAIKNKEESVN